MVVARGKGVRAWRDGGGLIYGDRRWFDFRWWTHSAMCRSGIMEVYTGNLCDPVDQCHPNKFNKNYF